MKKILIPALLLLLILLGGCQSKNNPGALSSFAEGADGAAGLQSREKDGEAVPDDIPLTYSEDAEKYFDYFWEHNYISVLLGDETGKEGFSDSEMAAYALCELIFLDNGGYDQATGYPKEEFDAVVLKYFGTTIQNYENQKTTVISETGNITSTGWGGNAVALVLKELERGADGVFTGVFYLFNFGMDGIQPTQKDDLLQGRFDNYGKPILVTITFEERGAENSLPSPLYLDVKTEGVAEPPYTVYQS